MLQPEVPPQIITPAHLSTPFSRADAILARYLLPKSVVLVCDPEVAVDGLHLCPPLTAIWYWALVGEGMCSLMLSVYMSAKISHASLEVWESTMVSYRRSNFFWNVREHEEKLQGNVCFCFGFGIVVLARSGATRTFS